PPLTAPLAAGPRLPDPAMLAEAADLLNRSRRPVILAGGGVRGQSAGLRALAARLDAPVVQTVNARGLMWGDPRSVAASPSLPGVRALIADADRILALGTEIGQTDYDMDVNGRMPDLSAMIRADVCPEQLARRPARLALAADAGAVIAGLLPLVAAKSAEGAARAAAAMAAARRDLSGLSPRLSRMLPMVEAMRDAVPGALIVGDSTQPVYAGNYVYDHDRAGGWFNAATGFGSLGFGPGAAVGAALGQPGVPVICLVGDGGLQFSPGELRSAVDEGLPITFLVWNSASYQEIAEAMEGVQIKVIGCHPSPLRMEPFAAACDLPFQSVANDPAELSAALRHPSKGPRMIEVRAPR
ncbi:MAG: hypothetical protein JSR87_02680, partial [Proteobacteria bacterium]|nr:hypothetical protein [Pseudomonadota bacterium]